MFLHVGGTSPNHCLKRVAPRFSSFGAPSNICRKTLLDGLDMMWELLTSRPPLAQTSKPLATDMFPFGFPYPWRLVFCVVLSILTHSQVSSFCLHSVDVGLHVHVALHNPSSTKINDKRNCVCTSNSFTLAFAHPSQTRTLHPESHARQGRMR